MIMQILFTKTRQRPDKGMRSRLQRTLRRGLCDTLVESGDCRPAEQSRSKDTVSNKARFNKAIDAGLGNDGH